MLELRPQFTYSPEGVFRVTTGLDEDYPVDAMTPDITAKMVRRKEEELEVMAEAKGIEVEMVDGIAVIAVDIMKRFRGKFNIDGEASISEFLAQLNRVLPYHPVDLIDRLVSLDNLFDTGANGVVYEHFQRWLNSEGFTEEIALECAIALARPFGAEVVKQVKRKFQYYTEAAGQMAFAHTSRITLADGSFGVSKVEDTAGAHIETEGEVEWRSLNISTLGSCACWGIDGNERDWIRVQPNTRRLYELSPHNVDMPRQSLSLLLGVGVLTRVAAGYVGDEDIYANTQWGKPRVYPSVA